MTGLATLRIRTLDSEQSAVEVDGTPTQLEVDAKGRNPIILDQPEENLDNETVVSLLVPVLNEAKKRRRIVVVTHNPRICVARPNRL